LGLAEPLDSKKHSYRVRRRAKPGGTPRRLWKARHYYSRLPGVNPENFQKPRKFITDREGLHKMVRLCASQPRRESAVFLSAVASSPRHGMMVRPLSFAVVEP